MLLNTLLCTDFLRETACDRGKSNVQFIAKSWVTQQNSVQWPSFFSSSHMLCVQWAVCAARREGYCLQCVCSCISLNWLLVTHLFIFIYFYSSVRFCISYIDLWCYLITDSGGRHSAVDIATRYGLDGPGIESRWGKDFPHPSRPALGPTQPPVQWVPGLTRR